MIADAVKEVASVLDRRFLMFIFVPSLFFWSLLVIVWFVGQGELHVVVTWWNTPGVFSKIVEITVFLGWVFIFALMMGGQSLNILRLYEGYWSFPGADGLKKLGIEWHTRILKDLNERVNADELAQKKISEAYERIYHCYPPVDDDNFDEVMPTRLGNILKASELYAKDRYEIDSVVIWSRLHKLFPAAFVEEIVLVRSALDFMLIITTLGLLFSIVSGLYLLLVRAEWWLFLLCFWGGLMLAWLAYRSALSNAVLYASSIKAGFDLYRNELLKQMRLPLPRNEIEEKETWKRLGAFIYSDARLNLPYTDPPPLHK